MIMEKERNWKREPGEILGLGPVMPVIMIRKREHAVPLARALVAGGIAVLEITLRTGVALDAIRDIIREVPEAVVGAGTVVTPDDLRAVTEAGAVFAISPGLTPKLLDAANWGPIALIPGISTVSELMTGLARGYPHFKFFPAGVAGGVRMLKAMAGPFPGVTFCPTGGIGAEDYREYLALGNVACVGGSWLAPSSVLEEEDWESITRLARQTVESAGTSGS
jgi:2-dehydro-3-deoxyphosphogluconate aldolase/(4S)-4-hydroxy-2-oxoglutarate aldolase